MESEVYPSGKPNPLFDDRCTALGIDVSREWIEESSSWILPADQRQQDEVEHITLKTLAFPWQLD